MTRTLRAGTRRSGAESNCPCGVRRGAGRLTELVQDRALNTGLGQKPAREFDAAIDPNLMRSLVFPASTPFWLCAL